MSTNELLPWQAQNWSRVNEARRDGRLAHALLLAGPGGVGKRSFARRLAASLLCESRSEDGTPCGQCRGCAQFNAGTHPNLLWVVRELNREGREKRDISIDQMREVMDRLALSSHYGAARVVVVDPADALNASGVNALLKTVEEPPPGTHIVLLSQRPMALAPTLRSRCQRLSFALPDAATAQAWLRAQAPQIDAAAALRDAGGAPLIALQAQESGLRERHGGWRDTWLAVAARQLDPVVAAARVAPAGSKLSLDLVQDWLRQFQRLLQRLLRARVLSDGSDAQAEALARQLGAAHMEQLLGEIVDGQRRLLGNANPQLLVESLMISWWRRSAAS
jgi:DNA polymerase III subunit delta'